MPGTAGEYLEKKRGPEVAALITDTARFFAKKRDEEPVIGLRQAERTRAARAARILQPLVRRDAPILAGFIDYLVRKYSGQAETVRPGRRKGKRASFVDIMLYWGASELGARGHAQLTATELIAAAAAVGFDGVEWSNRTAELDSWRHLRKEGLPANADALAEEGRKRMRECELERQKERTRLMAEGLRQTMLELRKKYGPLGPGQQVEETTSETKAFAPVE